MSTPTVTENIVALEPVTRDDFADPPAPGAAERPRIFGSVPVARDRLERRVPAAGIRVLVVL